MRNNVSSFIIFAVVVLGILTVLSVFAASIIRKGFPVPYIWAPFIVFPVIFTVTYILGNAYAYTSIGSTLYTITVFWVPILLWLCIGGILISIVSLFPVPQLVIQILLVLLGVSIVCGLVYGFWNARHPKTYTYTIEAEKLHSLWADKKIVLISDTHIGMVLKRQWLQKAVDMINAEKPDIVFIAGDLIDGPLFPFGDFLAPLKNIQSTYGVYYTAGNHDEYNRQQDAYYKELEKYVTVLNDKTVTVNQTQITGVVFAEESEQETKDRLFRAGYVTGPTPSIVMLHNPKNSPSLAEAGVTLTVSGHTHGGQFFPFTLLVRSMYQKLTKGIHYIGNMAQVTSVGFGTAGPILRIGTKPEIAVIKIK